MKRSTSVILYVFALMLISASAAVSPPEIMKAARELGAKGDLAGAVLKYRSILNEPKVDAKAKSSALYAIADLYLNDPDQFDNALASYDEIIALKDISPTDKLTARNRKANALMRMRTKERVVQMRNIWAEIGNDTSLLPAQRAAAWIALANNATASSVYANIEEAKNALEQAIAIDGLTDVDRANIYAQHIKYALESKDLPMAADYAQKIIDAPAANFAQKNEAFYQLSGIKFMQGDDAGATSTIQSALKMPDLTNPQRGAVFFNIALIHERMRNFKQARAAFEQAAEIDPNLKLKAETSIIATLTAEKQFDRAFKLHKSAGRLAAAAGVLNAKGDVPGALKLCREAISNPNQTDAEKLGVLTQYLEICNANNLFGEAVAILPEYKALAGGSKLVGSLVSLVQKAMAASIYPDAALLAEALLLNMKPASDQYFNIACCRINALAGMGELKQAATDAAALAKERFIKPINRFTFALMHSVLTAPDAQTTAKTSINTIETAFAQEQLSMEDRQKALLEAGRSAMLAKYFETARGINDFYESRFVPEPVKTYTVSFLTNAPASIDGFLASAEARNDTRRARFDRKFGGNLELVAATDAATGDRGDIRITDAAGDTETEFYAVCNEDGIHVFFNALDDKAPEVEAGLLRGGSFEGYIAAGERVPHTCFLVNLQTGKITLWNSAYATDLHTPITNDSVGFRAEFRHTKNAHLLYLFFDWVLFAANFPEPDDFWLFETARWARGGRVTWNGLKTVHGRSNFGHWRFDISKDNRLAIKRKLIFKALARYNAEKVPSTGGLIDFFYDKDYSDPAFYYEAVAPLRELLDNYAKRVSPTMEAKEIETLFSKAVPMWMNVRYRLSDLRRAYLERKLTSAD